MLTDVETANGRCLLASSHFSFGFRTKGMNKEGLRDKRGNDKWDVLWWRELSVYEYITDTEYICNLSIYACMIQSRRA